MWRYYFICLLFLLFSTLGSSYAFSDEASWYSVESCKREGTTGIMANGEVLDDDRFTCASWDWPFGTILRIFHLGRTNLWVDSQVCDRGPNKKLYKKGRTIDLSKAAFKELAPLSCGVIPIKVEVVK